MVNNILRLIVFILVSNPLRAQIQKSEAEPLGYGFKLGVTLTTIGAKYSDYDGLAGTTMGMFFTKPINNHFSWYLEPAFSTTGFRNSEINTQFKNYYLDLGGLLYYYPSSYNTDIALIGGFKPSYLVTYNSEQFEFGNYTKKELAINKNTSGKVDATATVGVGVSLSPVVNLELLYNLSLTNKNSLAKVQGRPSTIEFNLRLNAVALKKALDGKAKSLTEVVNEYHKGVLLVMLITPNEKEIKRLTAANKTDEVDLITTEIKLRNKKVIREFQNNFNFAPVYFFMDSSIYKVISGNLNGIFVNGNGDSDTSIKVNTENYFIASYCEDISNYTKRRHFGLFVYDKQMNQLNKPFNHPNQLASPVFDYVVVNKEENKTRRPSYLTVPFDRLTSKFNTRLFRYLDY